MIRTILITAATGLALSFPATAETKNYTVGDFNQIDVSAGVEVIFQAGETQSIVAENTNGKFEKLILETRGDTLVISRKSQSWFGGRNRERYKVVVTAPAVSSVEASSGANVKATGIIGDQVALSVSSGASLFAANIEAGYVDLEASSGSDLDAFGTCDKADFSSSSGASIDADELVCNSIDASASSGSSVRAHATVKVEGTASSGASVKVVGGATEISKDKSSGGSVTVT